MKPITLKEFAELAKNDEALKEKIIKSVKPDGGVPQELIDLAADYGYELTEEGIYSMLEDEELSDEELEKIAGGDGGDNEWKNSPLEHLCAAIYEFFGWDTTNCLEPTKDR